MIENINKKDIGLVLDKNDLANFFNIAYDEINKRYIFSLNKSIYIQEYDTIYQSYYTSYTIQEKDTWTLISYKFYNTIELWWLICKVNGISNPLNEDPIPGNIIKILNTDITESIMTQIRS